MKYSFVLLLVFLFSCGDNGVSLVDTPKNNQPQNNNSATNNTTTPIGKDDTKRQGDLQGTIPTLTSSEPIIQFGYDFYLAICKRIVDCRETPAVSENVSAARLASVASCLESLVGQNHPQRWKDSLDTSRLTFDDAQKGACLSSIPALACEAFDVSEPLPNVFSSCESVIAGQGAEQADCNSSIDCSGDLVCDDCPGICRSIPKLECATNELCDGTEFCNVETDKCETLHTQGGSCANDSECQIAFSCITGTCTARALAEPGDNCTDGSVICPMGYYCDGICRAYKVLGQTCQNNACEAPLFCESGTCKKGKETGDCSNGVECLSNECIGGMCAAPYDLCKLKE